MIPSGATHYVKLGWGMWYIKEDSMGYKYYHEVNRCWYYYDWSMHGTPIRLELLK